MAYRQNDDLRLDGSALPYAPDLRTRAAHTTHHHHQSLRTPPRTPHRPAGQPTGRRGTGTAAGALAWSGASGQLAPTTTPAPDHQFVTVTFIRRAAGTAPSRRHTIIGSRRSRLAASSTPRDNTPPSSRLRCWTLAPVHPPDPPPSRPYRHTALLAKSQPLQHNSSL